MMNLSSFLSNSNLQYLVIALLTLLIVVHSSEIEKSYPSMLQEVVDEPLFKLAALVLIVFVTRYNITIGILLTIVFIFSITDITLLGSINEGFVNGAPVSSCHNYNSGKVQQAGTAFYPLHDSNNSNDGKKEVKESNNHSLHASF